MNRLPEVSFIICTYNRASYLEDTLESLFRHGSRDFNYEIVVIDNNSTDNTSEVIKELARQAEQQGYTLRSFKETEQGLSYARNRGIKEAQAESMVFFDDDIRATDSLIPAWCTFFAENPKAQAAGGKIHVQFDDPRPGWMSHFLLPLLGHHDLGDRPRTYPGGKYPFGGNMGFRKSLLDKTGSFHTSLGRKGSELNAAEEKELFQRIRSLSVPIHYLPDALLYHRVDQSRLSKAYIRKQAMGLGRSMHMQLREASISKVLNNWLQEIGKLLATVPLSIGYALMLQGGKGIMLYKFRWWIWKGYRSGKESKTG